MTQVIHYTVGGSKILQLFNELCVVELTFSSLWSLQSLLNMSCAVPLHTLCLQRSKLTILPDVPAGTLVRCLHIYHTHMHSKAQWEYT